jgi:hypothetical protein
MKEIKKSTHANKISKYLIILYLFVLLKLHEKYFNMQLKDKISGMLINNKLFGSGTRIKNIKGKKIKGKNIKNLPLKK